MSLTRLVSFAEAGIDRRNLNGALSGARNETMLGLIGNPRGDYDETCRHPTNPRIAALMETADVGPFRVTGLKPAVAALRAILADVRQQFPAVHAALGTAGMLCCRLVRGSRTAISNHSWGTAIDLTVEGKLDRRGDDKAQQALLDIHTIFNRHDFFWGAAFPTEDAMHFEASDQLIRRWASAGDLGPQPAGLAVADALTIGDRSERVRDAQTALNLALAIDLDADGIFGAQTRAAVIEFQRRERLPITGTIDTATAKALLGADG
jgi:hypothetical protein